MGKKTTTAIDFIVTNRGFAIASFKDRYDATCSLQKSSLAFEDAIWLGVDQVDEKPARMHLTREMVAALLPALKMFVETGDLPKPSQTGKKSMPKTA